MTQLVGSLAPRKKTQTGFLAPGLCMAAPRICRHLGNKPEDSRCVCASLFESAFQVK